MALFRTGTATPDVVTRRLVEQGITLGRSKVQVLREIITEPAESGEPGRRRVQAAWDKAHDVLALALDVPRWAVDEAAVQRRGRVAARDRSSGSARAGALTVATGRVKPFAQLGRL